MLGVLVLGPLTRLFKALGFKGIGFWVGIKFACVRE